MSDHGPVRKRVGEREAELDDVRAALDREANEGGAGDREIGADGAQVRTLVIEAREDLEIARGVRQVLAPSPVQAVEPSPER